MGILGTRLMQGRQTSRYPDEPAALPERFRGRPKLDPSKCADGCRACADACPTGAITAHPLALDMGACVFCPVCTEACPAGAITFTTDHRLAARRREDLVVRGSEVKLAAALDDAVLKVLGRSLRLRHVAAGDDGACAAELNALGNVVFDLGRFGIQFVASPRHADGIVVSGPVTRNMVHALRETYAAVPEPKIVIAVGTEAISGGVLRGGEVVGGVPADIPVDLYVPGAPPHPFTMLDGILRLLGRLAAK